MNKKSDLFLGIIFFLIVIIPIFYVLVRTTRSDTQPSGVTEKVYVDSVTSILRVSSDRSIYPDPNITPGTVNESITQDNIMQNICAGSSWSTKSERPPASYTTALKKFQLGYKKASNPTKETIEWYSYPTNDPVLSHYEEDHLISLELGGNPTDPKNLWPEPYNPTTPDGGAKQKDAVENYLHKKVCTGEISLLQAQSQISFDWYAVYKEMIASQPLGSTSGLQTSTNDQDDE